MNSKSLSSIFAELSKLDEDTFPPVEEWNPPLCDNVDMRIDRAGKWYFMNSPIGRKRMVKLFSKVLRLDIDGNYYLVTPFEKIRILVDERPFSIIDFQVFKDKGIQKISFETNIGDKFILDEDHPIKVVIDKETEEPKPYVLVRSNLEAILSRNVYYKLVDLSQIKRIKKTEILSVESSGITFEIGRLSA